MNSFELMNEAINKWRNQWTNGWVADAYNIPITMLGFGVSKCVIFKGGRKVGGSGSGGIKITFKIQPGQDPSKTAYYNFVYVGEPFYSGNAVVPQTIDTIPSFGQTLMRFKLEKFKYLDGRAETNATYQISSADSKVQSNRMRTNLLFTILPRTFLTHSPAH